MQFGMFSFTAGEMKLRGFSKMVEILNDSLRITGLLGCSV